jgi:tight adherence protein C
MSTRQTAILAYLLLFVGLAFTTHALASVTPLARPTLGQRGLARRRALSAISFGLIEPLMRLLAVGIARLPLPSLRTAIEHKIERAGCLFGLCADESLALSVLGMCGATAAWSLAGTLGAGPIALCAALALAFALPFLRLDEEIRARQRSVARGLPPAIDLVAMCMGAGLDFSAALRLVVNELTHAADPLNQELGRVLDELSLGRTRRQALIAFGERVPSPSVRDFVSAVVQAEQKGNPLADVLKIQAQMLRMRRSVAAEEAAAHAAVLLMLPLMLLMCAVLLIMFGPFIVNGIGM